MSGYVIPESSSQWYLDRELAARALRGARSHRNGCNGKCKGVAADNILKRARVCCGQSSLAVVVLAQCWREHDEESSMRREGGGCEGERGLYVKEGRARCYLACSPDEISASSFRPSFPLLPRSSPPSLPRTPSSSSASLHSPPPTGFLRGALVKRKLFPRAPLSDFWLRWDFRPPPLPLLPSLFSFLLI